MTIDTKVNQLVINKLTKAQYQEASDAGTVQDTELYFITDATDDGNSVVVDEAVIENSSNPVSGGAVYSAITGIETDMQEAITSLETAIDGKLDGKSDTTHNHDDAYDTKGSADDALTQARTYTDTVASGKSDTTHNHDDDYDAKGSADTALDSANSYTDTKVSGLASTTVVDNKISEHNTSTAAHSDIRGLITELTTKLNNFLDVDDTTTDQLSEVLTLIDNNKGTLESLTTSKINVSDIVDNLTTSSASKVLSAAQGVAIKALIDALQAELNAHGHEIADVNGLQTALDGKAASSHGTHVTYSTTTPVMDGTASAGSASTVARSDHKHPTDTSRAAKTDLDSHTGNTTVHITAAERTTWNNKSNFSGSYNDLTNKPTIPAVDSSLSSTSTNPVQNKVINSALAGKANSSHGNHVPTTQTANNAIFLRNDNTWQTVTPANIGALPTSGGTINGALTVTGNVVSNVYVKGKWLQSTGNSNLGKAASLVCVQDDGWVYYRTASELRSDIGAAASSHNQAASTITAGTFAGQVVANASGQAVGTSLLRNSKLVSADTNPTVNGEICWTYK